MSISAACTISYASVTSASATGTLYAPAGAVATLTLTTPGTARNVFVDITSAVNPQLGQSFELPSPSWSAPFNLPAIDCRLTVRVTVTDTAATNPVQSTFDLVVCRAGQLPVTLFGADPTGSVDSSGAFQAAVNALAGTGVALYVPAGLYKFGSQVTLLSNLRIVCAPGVVIKTTMASGTGNPLVAAFSATYAGVPNSTNTSLAANAVVGSDQISVAANTLTVGGFINLTEVASGFRLANYKVLAVTGTGPYTVTLDRPVRIPFQSGDTVENITVISDVHIEGNGMLISGTGARYIEILGAWNCTVSDVRFDATYGMADERFISWDEASYNCHAYRLWGVGNGTITYGYSFESAEQCSYHDCKVTNVATAGVFFQDGIASLAENCSATACGNGADLSSASTGGDFSGSLSCTIRGGTYGGKNGTGILVDYAQDSKIESVDCIGNTGNGIAFTAAHTIARTKIAHCNIQQNGADGIAIPTSTTVTDTTILDCTTNSNGQAGMLLNGVDTQVMGGCSQSNTTAGVLCSSARIRGLDVSNNTTIGVNVTAESDLDGVTCAGGNAGGPIVISNGAGIVRMRGLQLESATNTVTYISVGTSVTAHLDECHIQMDGTGSIGIIIQSGAELTATRTVMNGSGVAGTTGFYVNGGTLREGPGTDASAFGANAYFMAASSYRNRKQTAVANGTTGVSIAWPKARANDVLQFTLQTIGGTVGHPKYTITAGTGFTFTSDASDTSTYEYTVP